MRRITGTQPSLSNCVLYLVAPLPCFIFVFQPLWDWLFFWQKVPDHIPLDSSRFRLLNPQVIRETALDLLHFPSPRRRLWGSEKVMDTHTHTHINMNGIFITHPSAHLPWYPPIKHLLLTYSTRFYGSMLKPSQASLQLYKHKKKPVLFMIALSVNQLIPE